MPRGYLFATVGPPRGLPEKWKLLEFEEEEESNDNAPIYIDDGDNYDETDLFCEEDDEKDNDLCARSDENPIAHLVQPFGHLICPNCVKKNNCQFCGWRISNTITVILDDLIKFFMSFSALILMEPQLMFSKMFRLVNFCKNLTFLCSRHLN